MSYKTENFKDISEFYPFYLSQHRNNLNRLLHIIGTILAITILILSLVTYNLFYFIFTPIAGYGFAWVGHFFIEKNKPATFKYPLFSFICDYLMIYDILSGKIHKKFNKHSIENIKFFDTNFF